jgi:hypothetical protein
LWVLAVDTLPVIVSQATFLCVNASYYMSCAGPMSTGAIATITCPVGTVVLGIPYAGE